METTIILSRIFGLYLILVSLSMLIRPKEFKSFIQYYTDHPSAISMVGIITLIFGCVVITFHFLWQDYLSVIISLLGCLLIAKGLARLLFPHQIAKMGKAFLNNPMYFTTVIICLIIGVFLFYEGYFVMPGL